MIGVDKMYKLNKDIPLTPTLIQAYINDNMKNLARQKKLLKYYKGKHKINDRVFEDGSKPNNKISNPYAHYITDMMTGYFVGEPIKYTSNDEDLLNEINAINNYNDEASNNEMLAADVSIYGVAYELCYIDEDGQIRYKKIETEGNFPIYEDNIEEDLLYFVRTYEVVDILNNNKITYVDVYTRDRILHYKNEYELMFLYEEYHSFGLVPVSIYKNNRFEIGDFETVISEIDAYDKLESDSLNEMEYFSDCYLALYGLEGTDSEDVAQMKNNRVLLFPNDSRAEWLTKSINDTYLENEKSRLDENIHKFSYCPPMTDEHFSENASGVAMKYKLLGLENATAKKETGFKVGLQRRFELICNILNLMGNSYDYRAINIIFTRNIPTNIVEMADVVNKIGHLYSEKTQMQILPIEADYEAEQNIKKEELENNYAYEFIKEVDDNG